MEQFCEDLIEFLKSQYSDTFYFDVTVCPTIDGLRDIELRIVMDTYSSTKTINSKVMDNIYRLYKSGLYYPERGEFAWQKELIDMIEGS